VLPCIFLPCAVLADLAPMYWLPVLSVLAAVPLGLATPVVLLVRWDDMRVKHTWATTPEKWECQGHPPSGTRIDLHIALKSHRRDALVDALYEVSDPKHPKYVSIPSALFQRAHAQIYCCTDMVRICQRKKLLGWSLHIRILLNSSTPGSPTTVSPPLSRPHTAATG
jgi:hypothetical protein